MKIAMVLVSLMLAGCGLDLEPIPQPVYVTAPENLRPRHDLITGQRIFNLVPRAEMDRRARSNLEDRLGLYRMFGLRQITDPAEKRLARLQAIADRVHRNSHLADRQIDIILIENNVFQAYTFGGGAVVFYTGLVERLDDDQLAGVVGHELAHIAAGHIAEETSRAIVNTNAPESLTPLAGFYGINDEMEADRVGLVYTILAGYDPAANAHFWADQARLGGRDILNPFADSHPPYHDRAAALAEDAALLLRQPPGESESDRQRYLRCNPLYCLKGAD